MKSMSVGGGFISNEADKPGGSAMDANAEGTLEARRVTLERRLEDGYARIEQAALAGAGIEDARLPVERDPPGVAEAERKDLGAATAGGERVVGRVA